MTKGNFDPLFGAAPKEIPLKAAPLVTVLYQVRFPEIISIQQKPFIAEFQEQVRSEYPMLVDEKLKTLAVNENGTTAISDESVWRFIDESKTWRMTLTSTFLSLETRKYLSRDDFVQRLARIMGAVHETIKPSHVTRMGMRYVDRVPFNNNLSLDQMLRKEMMGIAGSEIGENVIHSVSEVACKVKEGQMLAKWGMMPKLGSHDPDIMPPIADPSWFLDLDAFVDHTSAPIRFEADMIRDTAADLSTRCYAFFRWAVTEKFLEAFGGVTE